MSNIIITTHWSDGDVIPFINIGKSLKENGHEVTIFTHCIFEDKVKNAKLNFVAWDTPAEYSKLLSDMNNYSDGMSGKDEIQKFRDKYQSVDIRIKEYELLKPYCLKKDTVIIAKNRSSIAALMIAEKLKCPLIWVYMNPYEYESIENYSNLNEEKLCGESNELRKIVGLPLIKSWLAWQHCPKMQIGLWPQWYKSDVISFSDNIRLIGFPLKSIDRSKCNVSDELREVLIKSDNPIIISGGTSRHIRPDFYKAAINACSSLNKKVIVATRYKDLLPDNIPENVQVFDYIPLNEALSYAGLIIHHGGIGTISNAISAGVPQLILADYVDRPLNASIVKKIGLGEYLPHLRWDNENIISSINKLLTIDYKKKCIDFAQKHEGEDAFRNINEIVNNASNDSRYIIDEKMINCLENSEESGHPKGSKLNLLSNDMKKYLLEKIKNK